jgi:hypothetical protein
MADTSLAITTEYVRCFMAMVGKGISWPDRVLETLRREGLHQLDVTYVITHGEVANADKESADGANFVIIGETCDDVRISVEVWLDNSQLDYRVVEVSRL